ncbi:hypothetical protein C8R45DRAFT_212561 [Mycena sanguinolenta]|nr:hypothetical protein C8R45DRAFT_212561 [Mycena sanguinolenta]
MAAAEPPNQAVANPMAIPRPGLRPQTRTKIVEILAGTANGCLHELGYSPGLLEKVRYLEESLAKLKAENEKLKNFALTVEDLRKKALAYQQENVKMYEDNTKLFGDCELLRQELSALNMLAKKNEETRGMNTTQILGQYALLQLQYEDALKQIQRLKPKNAAPAQSQPQASGPYPVRSQPPPAVVPSQVLLLHHTMHRAVAEDILVCI